MAGRIVILAALAAIAGILWLAYDAYEQTYLRDAFFTFVILAAAYLVFKFLFEEFIAATITEGRTRYRFRRMVSILFVIVSVIAIIAIWVEDTQTLLVFYGLIAAGVAIAVQDVFKNIAGGIIIFMRGIYRVGDRIEVKDKFGDVIDVGLLYTTCEEIREWIPADQTTGRLSVIPNGYILSEIVNNYTRDHKYIWDSIVIPITYDSDWRAAGGTVLEIVRKETAELTEAARDSLEKLADKYFVRPREVDPGVYFHLTDNWIELHVRYAAEIRLRRLINSRINELVLDALEKMPSVTIASETVDVTVRRARQFPP